ncbi:MAG: Uncharacterised protein [Flavobacterium sp. SCGC AAA160-P02]|nr:MAG: Uncharacterised protein [Flavobacterium sp. SCGC AAA160-P02]
MKKVILITFLVLFSFTANAQELKFGAKAGVNFASVTGSGAVGFDGRTSFHFGITSEIEISESFSLQPELTYSGQGFTGGYTEIQTSDDTFVEGYLTGRLNYLNLPVMAKYYVNEAFSLEFGPQIGFLLNAKTEESYSGSTSITTDVTKSLKSTDFSVNFGAGYKIESGLNFGLRYNLGLTNFDADDDDLYIKNGVFQVSVGYNF